MLRTLLFFEMKSTEKNWNFKKNENPEKYFF